MRIRGFVLAAGYGERLRPLTLFLPKPLLPVAGEPVLGHTLRRLAAASCEAVAVNLHHLPEAVPRYLGASYHGLPLIYSFEEEIQGTLGALWPQRDFLSQADLVLLVNGDTLCAWPWRRLIRSHLRSGAEATLLVLRRAPDPALGGGVGLDAAGRVVALRDAMIGDATAEDATAEDATAEDTTAEDTTAKDTTAGEVKRRHVFAGAHVLSRRLLGRLVEGPGDIIGDLYIPLLAAGGHIEGVVTGGRWHDLGTPERYLEAHLDWIRGRWPGFRRRRSWISPLARIHPTSTVVASAVEQDVRIGEETHVESSVLLPGAEVAAGSRIERSIVGPGVRLPAAAGIEGRMINRTRLGHLVSARESVMGDLVYTPLDQDHSRIR